MPSVDQAMATALALARRGMGTVRPNPPVGAVVLSDGRVVGRGYHHRAGGDHAEMVALAEAGARSRGATLVVTLEPCNHQGQTPPCVPAIVRAGIARVVLATQDPNPASGQGGEALKKAGIEVLTGPRGREARHLIAGFASRLHRGRPRVVLKMAASLDGRIATASGESRWISSPVARAWAHRRRREADAIMVGVGTVLRDDPALTTRAVKGRSPDRIVVDSRLRAPAKARVWAADGARRIAATTEASERGAREALTEQGVQVWMLPTDSDGHVDLGHLVRRMGDEGYTNLLAEGGGKLAGALFGAHLVDLAWVVTARQLILGGGGPGWAEGLRVASVPRALKVSRAAIRVLGPDWLVTLVPEFAAWWDPETAHV